MARPFSPEFSHADRERWICLYPAYINSKKTVAEGRRIPKDCAVENPTHTELKEVCTAAGLTIGIENKVYPRELYPRDMMYRGRIRIHFRDENGKPLHEKFPTKKSIFLHCSDMIPKLKSRTQQQRQQVTQQSGNQQSKARQRGKKKK